MTSIKCNIVTHVKYEQTIEWMNEWPSERKGSYHMSNLYNFITSGFLNTATFAQIVV